MISDKLWMEFTKEELSRKGFVLRPGLLEGVVYDPELYMVYNRQIADGEVTIIMKKLDSNTYKPHRAEDVNGHQYGERELIYQEPVLDTGMLEELVEKMENPPARTVAA